MATIQVYCFWCGVAVVMDCIPVVVTAVEGCGFTCKGFPLLEFRDYSHLHSRFFILTSETLYVSVSHATIIPHTSVFSKGAFLFKGFV